MKKGEYAKLLERIEWSDKRITILERDKHTCQRCNKHGGELHVHHHY